jgi:cathepsin L
MATKLLSGPLSVCVDASKWSDYGSGIFKCSTTVRINHAVVIVGVDSTGNWKVRNSWGAGWGEAGYIRISANKSNNCGIEQYAAFPILK